MGEIPRALCKYQGRLVIAEFTKCVSDNTGRCPECGGTIFSEHQGWTECEGECGFAILTNNLKTIEGKSNG